jgi:small-conductance mechanosensitive channel/CRP-like cAMP-binding protein
VRAASTSEGPHNAPDLWHPAAVITAARFQRLLDAASFGGAGLAVALGLIVVGWFVLDRHERGLLRGPAALVTVHAAVAGACLLLPERAPFVSGLHVLAFGLLLLAIGRASFLLLIHALVVRRGRVPLPRIIQDILQGLLYTAVLLAVLRASGVEPSSLLTTSALLTAVLGLSLQETLGNLFAGLAIQAQRPFEIDDWIQFDADASNVGRVVEINWRATRVRTVDGVEVTVPNGALARASIRNYSKPTSAVRRSVTVALPYAVPPTDAHAVLLQAVRSSPEVLQEPAPDVVTLGFGDAGVEYKVRFWTDQFGRREPVDGDVRDRVWFALQRAGHPIPFPARTVLMHDAGHEARAADQTLAAEHRERTLRFVDLFRGLPDDVLDALARGSKRRFFMAGETVIAEGDEGDELFVVERGEVEVLLTRHGEAMRVSVIGASGFFGEMSLMTGERRRATVRALGPSALLVVDKAVLAPVLGAHPEFALEMSTMLAARELALGQVPIGPEMNGQAVVEVRSRDLLDRIRKFFGLR